MMDLIRWNPARDIFGLRGQMGRVFDDFFTPTRSGHKDDSIWSWNPAVDVYDEDDLWVVTAEIPGVDKKDITVDVKDRVLTIRGERASENEVKEDKFYRRERFYGKFERSFNLPPEVDPDKIQANYKDGVLKIEVPKSEAQKPTQIAVH
jgi:HSP20 family protein